MHLAHGIIRVHGADTRTLKRIHTGQQNAFNRKPCVVPQLNSLKNSISESRNSAGKQAVADGASKDGYCTVDLVPLERSCNIQLLPLSPSTHIGQKTISQPSLDLPHLSVARYVLCSLRLPRKIAKACVFFAFHRLLR